MMRGLHRFKVAIPLLLLIVTLFSVNTSTWVNTTNDSTFVTLSNGYETHDPILIQSNEEFESLAFAEGWDGNGNENNPYLIDGYEIHSDMDCIYIANVNVHFWIRNCVLTSFSESDEAAGIYLEGCSNGTILACDITAKSVGIRFSDSHACVIHGNIICHNTGRGIVLDSGSSHNEISENKIGWNALGNAQDDGRMNHWDSCLLSGNYWSDFEGPYYYYIPGTAGSADRFPILLEILTDPVDITSPPDMTIIEESDPLSIIWYFRSNVAFTASVLCNVSGHGSALITSTTPVSHMLIFRGLSGLSPGGYEFTITVNGVYDSVIVTVLENPKTPFNRLHVYGDSHLATLVDYMNWTGEGTQESPFLIEGYEFHDIFNNPIILSNVRKHIEIRNCRIGYGSGGFDYTGIVIHNATNVVVNHCEISSRESAILVNGSQDCSLKNNKIFKNNVGIEIDQSSDISIDNNTISNNWQYGILINRSSFVNIRNCNVTNNECGMYFCEASSNTVFENRLIQNYDYGFRLVDNLCSNNTFVGNTIGLNENENARDDGSDNHWDNGIDRGNNWDDYNGSGFYYLSGSAGSIDHYPYGMSTTTTTNHTSTIPVDWTIPIIGITALSTIIIVVIFVLVRKKPSS